MSRVDLHFANASCAHCVRLVTKSLEKMDGVVGIDVDRVDRRLIVDFDPARTSIESICSAMEQTGYPTRPVTERVAAFRQQFFPQRAA